MIDMFRSALYYYDLKSAEIERITDDDITIDCVRFSIDNKQLFYFERSADGPHQAAFRFVSVGFCYLFVIVIVVQMSWPEKIRRVVVDIVQQPAGNYFSFL